jgi:hypothetical protein
MDDLAISCGDGLPYAQISAARLEADGKPKDIKRIYRDVLNDGRFGERQCTINNDAYSLIEHHDDIRIFKPIEEDDDLYGDGIEHEVPALVILDRDEQTVGIIIGE